MSPRTGRTQRKLSYYLVSDMRFVSNVVTMAYVRETFYNNSPTRGILLFSSYQSANKTDSHVIFYSDFWP